MHDCVALTVTSVSAADYHLVQFVSSLSGTHTAETGDRSETRYTQKDPVPCEEVPFMVSILLHIILEVISPKPPNISDYYYDFKQNAKTNRKPMKANQMFM